MVEYKTEPAARTLANAGINKVEQTSQSKVDKSTAQVS